MTTLLNTFEAEFRVRLLDVIYRQWRDLGSPFSLGNHPAPTEVIDPEALLWCSLEFIATDARLLETVLEWFDSNKSSLIQQRLNGRSADNEPRSLLWQALSNKAVSGEDSEMFQPLDGLESPAGLADLIAKVTNRSRGVSGAERLGRPRRGSSTLLLRARDLLGPDIRHFLLVYLLSNPGGGRLRTVQRWSGFTYRGVSEAAKRWTFADIVSIDHGFCQLNNPQAWTELLQRQENLVLIDWFRCFDASIRLLRNLAQAKLRNLSWDNPVIATFMREAHDAISAPPLGGLLSNASLIAHLLDVFSKYDLILAAH